MPLLTMFTVPYFDMHAQVPARGREGSPAKAAACQQTHTYWRVGCRHAPRCARLQARQARPKTSPALLKTRLRAARPQATKNQTVCMTGGGPRKNTRRGPQNQQQKGPQTLSQQRRGATCRWLGQ